MTHISIKVLKEELAPQAKKDLNGTDNDDDIHLGESDDPPQKRKRIPLLNSLRYGVKILRHGRFTIGQNM